MDSASLLHNHNFYFELSLKCFENAHVLSDKGISEKVENDHGRWACFSLLTLFPKLEGDSEAGKTGTPQLHRLLAQS